MRPRSRARDEPARRRAGGRLRRRSLISLAVVVLLALGSNGLARAQTQQNELEPFNFAFAAYVGSGIYSGGSQTVWLLRIPVTVPVWTPEEQRYRVRMRIRANLGFYDFEPREIAQGGFPDNVGTASLMVGADVPVRIYDNWEVRPFLDGGPAWESETDRWSGILGLGLLSRAEWQPWESPRRLVLWNELVRAINFGNREFQEEGFGKFLTDLELRQPIGLTVGGHRLAVGPFVKAVRLFGGLEIGGVVDSGRTLRARYEVGVRFGTDERVKLWRIPVPRIGLSYRFGQGVTSVRFILSARF